MVRVTSRTTMTPTTNTTTTTTKIVSGRPISIDLPPVVCREELTITDPTLIATLPETIMDVDVMAHKWMTLKSEYKQVVNCTSMMISGKGVHK